MDLKFYLAVFLRRLPYVLLLTILGAVIGGTLAVLLPPVYHAEARLVIESEQIPTNLAESTVRTGAAEQLQIIQQRILTRDNLLEMANRLGVYEPQPGQAETRLTADRIVADMRQRISIASSGGQQSGRGSAAATIVTVSFDASTSQLAAAVTNEVVTLILSENVEMRTRTAGQTLDFFEQEVERLDRELAAKGAAIQAFQESHRDALPDSLEFRRGQLMTQQQRLMQLQTDVAGLRERRDNLVELYESTGSIALSPGQALTPQQQQLQGLKDQLTASLAVMSPSNPRVAMLQNQISALEAQIASQGVVDPTAPDAGLTAYELQLADLDNQIDIARQQMEQVESSMADLQRSIEATPGNGLALLELQRDFSNVQTQYDRAVQSRALAERGELIEALAKGQRISVIEQAIPPAAPISPNRPLIAAAGVGGGLALGLGLVVLLELADRSIRRPVELTSRLGLTPFAALPLMRSRYDIRRRRLRMIAAFLFVLIFIPGTLWLVHSRLMPLDLVVDRTLERLTSGFRNVQDRLG